MQRIAGVDIYTVVTQFECTIEQSSLVHQGNVLEKYHRAGWPLVLFSQLNDSLPVVVGSQAHHAHLVDIVLVVIHQRRSKADTRNGTQYRHKPTDQITATQRNEHRDSTQHPERDRETLAAVNGRNETREACEDDIVGLQVRIDLCMPDAGHEDQQDHTQRFAPGEFFRKYQTKYEKQSEPSQYRIDANAQQIPGEMPFSRGAACCPQEQQHEKVTNRLREPIASDRVDIYPIAKIDNRCEQAGYRQEHQCRGTSL